MALLYGAAEVAAESGWRSPSATSTTAGAAARRTGTCSSSTSTRAGSGSPSCRGDATPARPPGSSASRRRRAPGTSATRRSSRWPPRRARTVSRRPTRKTTSSSRTFSRRSAAAASRFWPGPGSRARTESCARCFRSRAGDPALSRGARHSVSPRRLQRRPAPVAKPRSPRARGGSTRRSARGDSPRSRRRARSARLPRARTLAEQVVPRLRFAPGAALDRRRLSRRPPRRSSCARPRAARRCPSRARGRPPMTGPRARADPATARLRRRLPIRGRPPDPVRAAGRALQRRPAPPDARAGVPFAGSTDPADSETAS